MTIRDILATKYFECINVFQAGLDAGTHFAATRHRPGSKGPEEPDFVYGIFKRGLEVWQAGLDAIVLGTGYGAKVGGVYCHQSPKVRWTNPAMRHPRTSVELGDLLVVVRLQDPTVSSNTALLLQSKRQLWLKPLPSDDQFVLYNEWPEFKYVAGPLKDYSRTVGEPSNLGAQYHLIDDSLRPGLSWHHSVQNWTAVADKSGHRSPMALELTRLLLQTSGRPFTPEDPVLTDRPAEGDWNTVIWDLLTITGKNLLTRKAMGVSGKARPPRGSHPVGHWRSSTTSLFLATSLGELPIESTEDLPPPPHDAVPDLEWAGISLVVIDIFANEGG